MSIVDRINDYFYKKRRDKMYLKKIEAYPYHFVDNDGTFFLVFNINKNKELHRMYKEATNGLKCIFFYKSYDNVITESSYLLCKTVIPNKSYEDGSNLFVQVTFYIADKKELDSLDEEGKLIPMIEEMIEELRNFPIGTILYAVEWYDVDYENTYEHRTIKRKKLKL